MWLIFDWYVKELIARSKLVIRNLSDCNENQIHGHFVLKEGVPVTIGNPAFWLALYLTGVHFRAELQHVGDVSEQKRKYGPIRTREIGGARLSEALYVNEHKTIKQD